MTTAQYRGSKMQGNLQRIDMFGNSYVGRWKVWTEQGDSFIEVSCGEFREAAMLTVEGDSSCTYKREAWRIFNRMVIAENNGTEPLGAG